MDYWIYAYMIHDSLKAHMPLELVGTINKCTFSNHIYKQKN